MGFGVCKGTFVLSVYISVFLSFLVCMSVRSYQRILQAAFGDVQPIVGLRERTRNMAICCSICGHATIN